MNIMEFNNFPTILIITGLAFLLISLVWQISSKFLPLGKLPGDIKIEKDHFKFYFPLGTSIVISIVLSGLWWIIRHFKS